MKKAKAVGESAGARKKREGGVRDYQGIFICESGESSSGVTRLGAKTGKRGEWAAGGEKGGDWQ